MISTNGLNHLALAVKDPQRSAQFYADLFNMEITYSSAEIAFLNTVGSKDLIALNRSEVEVVSGRNTMHFGFIVDPEQFDVALRTIEEKSVKKVSEPSKRDIGRYIFIEDLDGYTVEIFEYL
jgi:catechol 2,3-dioxygenase-like lactoylglutathione lyase family enzyme